MRRPSSSGSLHRAGGSVPPEEKTELGRVGSFHSILDGLGEEEEEETMTMGEEGTGVVLSATSSTKKKRRLCAEQVKALEKNFEVENKLEPERKVKLARELGLQPRQVAVWFQNRRARWKIKQLERDYGFLKDNYDALKSDYDGLVHNKESLLAEIKELKSKLAGESSYGSVKEEPIAGEGEGTEQTPQKPKTKITTSTIVNATANCGVDEQDGDDAPPLLIYKDRSCDSDSSAILNDISSPPRLVSHHIHLLDELTSLNRTSSSTSSPFQLHDDRRVDSGFSSYYYNQQEEEQGIPPWMEESEFEPCGSFFSDKLTTPLPSTALISGVEEAWWWQT